MGGGYTGGGMPMQQVQMRTSQEQMRMSGGSVHSHSSQYSQSRPYGAVGGYGQPRDMRGSWDKNSSTGSIGSARDSRDSRGSRGSYDGLRMSGGPEMAGVGIFFQQEPTTGRVYVANIVEKGSADRSGVIKVNDVIVKIDDQDVQGQPLSTMRNLILGKQGTYVVLAFRRMTGTELYYFDVELVRGSPEYFESLKKSQAVADEKEKLLMQVRQQEGEIQSLRQKGTGTAGGANAGAGDAESIKRDIAAKNAEIQRIQQMLRQEQELSGHASLSHSSSESALVTMRKDNVRLNEQLVAATDKLQSTKERYQEMVTEWQRTKERLQSGISSQPGSGASADVQKLQAENQRLKQELQERYKRDVAAQQKLRKGSAALDEIVRNNDQNSKLLQELMPTLESLHTQLLVGSGYIPTK